MNDILTVSEVLERAKAELPHMAILDARGQYAKELARHILDLHEKPAPCPTVDDLLATIDIILECLGPDRFFTQSKEDRAIQWADTLPIDLKVVFLTRLNPLVGEDNRDVISTALVEFWK